MSKVIVTSTGWYGVPGQTPRNPKVHAVYQGKPICGAKLPSNTQYQWCAHGLHRGYLECERCLKILRRADVEEPKVKNTELQPKAVSKKMTKVEALEELDRVRDNIRTINDTVERLIERFGRALGVLTRA